MLLMDENDRHSLALCIWKESRGDGAGAMHAVAHVILNRCGCPGFGRTVHDVIYGKNQFTSMSVPSDPEFNLDPEKATGRDAELWTAAQYLVSNLPDDDETKGAKWYVNLKTEHSEWFDVHIIDMPNAHPVTFQYGHHTFYA